MCKKTELQDHSGMPIKTPDYYHRIYCMVRIECANYTEVKDIFESAHSKVLKYQSENASSEPGSQPSSSSSSSSDRYAQAYSALLFASGASFFMEAKSGQFQVILQQSPRLAALCAEKSIKFLMKESKANTPVVHYAQCLLGMFHYLGLGVEQNYRTATKWFEEAARNGVDLALYKLSICHSAGHGVAKDELKSFEYCLKAAQNGFPEAQRRMGRFYQSQLDQCTLTAGFGQEMLRWYQAASEQGFSKAQYDLANCYRKIATRQEVFEKFTNEALERSAAENCIAWYTSASEKGHLHALYNLAECYLHGLGTSVKIKKGMQLLQKAADRNCAEAIFELGKRYRIGSGVAKNDMEAKRLLRKAATDHDHIESQFTLADLLSSSSSPDTDDAQEAAAWYISAANAGHSDAMVKAAECFTTGFGVNIDLDAAAKWYERAAEMGNATAQHRFGCCLLMGDGILLDHSKALKWFSSAAARNHVESFVMIGQCYAIGMGVEKDAWKALCWFKKAARVGSVDAQYYVGCRYRDGVGVKVDVRKAREYFELAASRGHEESKQIIQGEKKDMDNQNVSRGFSHQRVL